MDMQPDQNPAGSRLLSLPTELRLQIWELLLAPSSRNDNITTVSRMCSTQLGTIHRTAVSHDWESDCSCHARSFYLLDNNKSLCPALLQVNRHIYEEALPCLYRNRAFSTDPNRTYETLHDKICDSWFLMDRFLAALTERARSNIYSIKVPMLLSKFDVYGCRQAFYSISSRLPALKTLLLEVCPSSVRETSNDNDSSFIHHLSEMFPNSKYWLGPVMAFDATIKIVMAGKNDRKKDPSMSQALPTMFDGSKHPVEVSVWHQLLPLRFKRESRRIARIRTALGTLDYADCSVCHLHQQSSITNVLFAGIGDARHFYTTLAAVASHERKRPSPKNKRYHFTLVDLKASALARDLILFWLLDELSNADGQAERDTAVAIYYIFVGTIMPFQAYEKLQSSIAKITNTLEADSKMTGWLFVGKSHRPALIKHLNSWATTTGRTTRSMRSSTHLQHNSTWVSQQIYMSSSPLGASPSTRLDGAPPVCRQEMAVFNETAMLQPPAQYIKDHEPKLKPLVLRLQNQLTSAEFLAGFKAPETHLDDNWCPNVTLENSEWQDDRKKRKRFCRWRPRT
ncbi:hypothetical protein E2P81_ATG07103 [Venturia nashicola]|uniref:Uncharacterized protein n=1 Tax=Venturia nashicola TaxID=86259 RepID=A0A4Z1P1D2_9PEZI|nr:hypothetical protein E6O75_ATG07266 [Venturia nashicola]TLD19486.1 hypothetical protein E2P81_ATG07103 [Venturia nashicola]